MRSAYILCQSNKRIDAVNPIRLRRGASSSQGKGPGTKHVGKAEKNRRDVLSDSRMDQKSTECENEACVEQWLYSNRLSCREIHSLGV